MTSAYGPKQWALREAKAAKRLVKMISAPDLNDHHPGAPHTPESEVMSIPDILKTGTFMTQISEKKQKKVLFRIDPDEGRIIYKSGLGGMIPIESIKELRTAHNCRYYRVYFKAAEELEDRWITVIYILDGRYNTLHMVAGTRNIFDLWDAALRKLFAVRQGLMSGLGNVEVRQNIWERQYWKGADEEGDQVLDFEDVAGLCMRLNLNLTKLELKKLFEDADTQKRGFLDFADFQRFGKVLKRRPDIEAIYNRICMNHNGSFDLTAFRDFMREFQKSDKTDDELQLLFHKYSTTLNTHDDNTTITLEGFSTFLISPDNAAFSAQDSLIWQEMTHPISDYYISSSHNTYLVGHQLVGVSTIEGYIRALLHSCRSVELDIYDGDEGPMIYHGNTLTSRVSLLNICQAINKYAFMTSPYPLLISAEIHCGIEQQDQLVDIMNDVFGDSLVQAPIEGRPKIKVLPSPEDLKNKFLLKAKNLYVVDQLAAVQARKSAEKTVTEKAPTLEASTATSSDSESGIKEELTELKSKWRQLRGKDHKDPEKPKVKMAFRLPSLLVYTVGVKCHGIHPNVEYAPEHIFSLSESTANKQLKLNILDLVKHNQSHLVRIYPKGTRVNSSNYQPHRYWAAGAQLVAINWQTFDLGYMINQAMFQRNGRAGYVLKPEALRSNAKDLFQKRTQHFFDVTIISAQQLPRLRDSTGREIIEKSIVDPFVEVSLHIPDWSHSPFLPELATMPGTKYSPPSDATTNKATSARTVSYSTAVIKNNGFNPVWQEEFSLPFDCIGDMTDLIFVEFAIRQKGKDDDDDAPIAVYCTPLACLERGFRHLPLHDSQLTQYLFSTLFVEIDIRDAN